jgi:hypothetical protein
MALNIVISALHFGTCFCALDDDCSPNVSDLAGISTLFPQLILPYVDVPIEYYDLGIEHRDATNDQVYYFLRNYCIGHGCSLWSLEYYSHLQSLIAGALYTSSLGVATSIIEYSLATADVIPWLLIGHR